MRRHARWLYVLAIIGGSTLLADGIITPPISVSSAVEGLRLLDPTIQTIPIVIAIITGLFILQGFGTKTVGRLFGPVMMLWFSMLAVLGVAMIIRDLSNDQSVPKYATHLVYLTSSPGKNLVEKNTVESIFVTGPKRADIYWFLHVETLDDPYTTKYKIDVLTPEDLIKITFRLGFRVEPRISLFFRQVLEEMVQNKEVDITSRYESLHRKQITGDFQFIIFESFLSYDNDLPFRERVVMQGYFFLKRFTLAKNRWFRLESSNVQTEKVPLVIRPVEKYRLEREEEPTAGETKQADALPLR